MRLFKLNAHYILIAIVILFCAPAFANSYTLFESGQVRPIAMSENGRYLYVVNTPAARLQILEIKNKKLRKIASVSVGLEPVAVAVENAQRVWVVNHLSDSVSIVDVSKAHRPRVINTLLVGDEPRDIVFAGTRSQRAFITTAHRGQNSPIDPQLTTPSVGRADVWVFNTEIMDFNALNHAETIISLFADTPRALAVSADRKRVYAAGYRTTNRTTSIREEAIPDGGEAQGGLPSTRVDADAEQQPETGLIVQFNGEHWVDELGRHWDSLIPFNLPDKDVFVIDADAELPKQLTGAAGYFTSVGTVIFNMVVNPVNDRVYVSNTEALNLKRFEGPGLRLGREHTVQGHFVENRISVLDAAHGVRTRHLNKHIDYSVCCRPIPNDENLLSVAQPMQMAISADGQDLYLAAFGSNKIVRYKTSQLEDDSFVPNREDQIELSGGGPSGLVLDEARQRIYVVTRFNNAVAMVNLRTQREEQSVALYNPEPQSIIRGRRFLYDASLTSSHGDSACASCHVFGDMDNMAWDLGNPDAVTINNPGPYTVGPVVSLPQGGTSDVSPHFRALKGPMTTQSLRGLANHGPMHWRGDRTGGNDEESEQPDKGAFNEVRAFKQFSATFVDVHGRDTPLDEEAMQQFAEFVLQITYPPNPIRNLDNSLTEAQAAGKAIYFGEISDTLKNCVGCHKLDRDGNKQYGVDKPGFFGTEGRYAFDNIPQFMKVPHLRNVYQKIGMFGMPALSFILPDEQGFPFMGDQIKGFGFLNDGTVDTIYHFMGFEVFAFRPPGFLGPQDPGNPGGFPYLPPEHPQAPLVNPVGQAMRRNAEQFVFAYDSNLFPIVGQQITYTSQASDFVKHRVKLLMERADQGECELVVKTRRGKQELGYLYQNAAQFVNAMRSHRITYRKLIRKHKKRPLTFTCVPPGSGERLAFAHHEREDD